jgi:hypothetical protein
MKQIYFFSSLILLFSSCTLGIKYVGSASAPTSHVDVFVDKGSIKKSYEVVGKGYVDGIANSSRAEKIQSKAIEKAMKKGADAVLIQDYYVPNTGTSINTVLRSDSIAKGKVIVGNTSIQATGTGGFTIHFLKYTN